MKNRSVRRVVAIDDDWSTLLLFGDIAAAQGWQFTAHTGESLQIEDLVRLEPDLLIVDLLLTPGPQQLTGRELLRLIASHHDLHRIPVIVCAGNPAEMRAAEEELRSMPAVTMLAKPFDIAAMEEAVRRLMVPTDDAPGGPPEAVAQPA